MEKAKEIRLLQHNKSKFEFKLRETSIDTSQIRLSFVQRTYAKPKDRTILFEHELEHNWV